MTANDNKDAFLRWVQAWNDGDLEAIDDLVAPDFRTYYQGGAKPVDSNRQAHKDRVRHAADIYSDHVSTMQEVASEGEFVMGRGTFTGTHVGKAAGGAEPDNRKWQVQFAVITRWAEGQLVEERRFWGAWSHVD